MGGSSVNNRNTIQYHDHEEDPFLPTKGEPEKTSLRKELEIAALMLMVIGFGALNRVCSKIMSEPMNNYSFFLSLFNGIAYVVFYGLILAVRYALGYVPKKMLLFPFRVAPPYEKTPSYCMGGGPFWTAWDNMYAIKYFVATGFLDSLGNIMGNIANPYISGIMGSLATQCMLLFAMPTAVIMLGTRYTIFQVLAAGVVLTGAMVAIVPDLFHSNSATNGPVGYIFLMAMSNFPGAISFTTKELIFKKEKQLELFVVNTAGSFFQMLWWPLMIPITLVLGQTDGLPMSTYIRYGFMCFLGTTPHESHANCSPMPTPWLVYIFVNLAFNICLLLLLKKASALQGFMAVKAILPVGVFLFLIKWPLIGKSSLSLENTISLIVILLGLGLYRYATYVKEKKEESFVKLGR